MFSIALFRPEGSQDLALMSLTHSLTVICETVILLLDNKLQWNELELNLTNIALHDETHSDHYLMNKIKLESWVFQSWHTITL